MEGPSPCSKKKEFRSDQVRANRAIGSVDHSTGSNWHQDCDNHLVLPPEDGDAVEDLVPLLHHPLARPRHYRRSLHDAAAGEAGSELTVLGAEVVRYARVGPVRAAESGDVLRVCFVCRGRRGAQNMGDEENGRRQEKGTETPIEVTQRGSRETHGWATCLGGVIDGEETIWVRVRAIVGSLLYAQMCPI